LERLSRALSPEKFAGQILDSTDAIEHFSRILRIMASHATGREITAEKVYTAPA
jgi:hypothetical protein